MSRYLIGDVCHHVTVRLCLIFPCEYLFDVWATPPAAAPPQPQSTTTTIRPLMFDPHTDEPPPPSYDLSQEAFDQKTRQEMQASLEAPSDTLDLWEVWDEATHTANARALADTEASSSSSAPPPPPVTAHQYPKEKPPGPPPPPQQEEPAVRPLRIVKRSQAAAYKKAAEASSYQSNTHSGGPTPSSDEGPLLGRSFSVLSAGRITPPPMFESVGPNYDGPDYDEVAMTYVPGGSRPSSPMSVLSNDSYRPPVPPPPRMTAPRPNTFLPPPPPPLQRQPAPRPMSTQVQRHQYQQPRRRVGFDPMSAYNKPKTTFIPHLDPTPERIDPSSFYK